VPRTIYTSGDSTINGATTLQNTLRVLGQSVLSYTRESTSVTTGSLIVSGGVGISSNVYIGGNTYITGTTTINNALLVTGTTTINNALRVTGQSILSNTSESTSVTTGSLVVSGGLGIKSNVNIGGNINLASNRILALNTGSFIDYKKPLTSNIDLYNTSLLYSNNSCGKILITNLTYSNSSLKSFNVYNNLLNPDSYIMINIDSFTDDDANNGLGVPPMVWAKNNGDFTYTVNMAQINAIITGNLIIKYVLT
jgi:hypothetical protein